MKKASRAASLFPEAQGGEVAYGRKPQGYWNEFASVGRELLAFIDEHGTPGVMPTNTELGKAGRSDLQNALAKHGGYPSVAARLGLACAKKQQGYWDDFANVERGLRAFIQERGASGVMPTSVELGKAGRGDLAAAISKHGGYPSVAARLRLACAKKQQGYWDDFANVERGLRAFIQERDTSGVMPTQDELTKAKRGDLKNAISKKHGGYPAVAKRLGLEFTRTAKPRGYWSDFSNVERGLQAFIKEHGTPGVMPTAAELARAGRGDLTGAISNHHGGYLAVAEQLGLRLAYVAKPPGYWDDFANVERGLRAFIQERGTSGVMPTKEEFAKAGRSDLIGALRKHGSYSAVAERLGLKLAYATKPSGYWDDFSNLERDLHAFIQEHGPPGMMPADTELTRAGRSDLKNAIRRHGGYPAVAERLGLEFSYKAKPSGYWDSFSNVEHELLAFIKEHGTPGEIPTDRELREARRSDLAFALQVHGGYLAVARRLNLIYARLERISPKTASEAEKTARAIQPLAESNLLSGAQVMVILRRAGLLKFCNQRVVRLNAGLARGDHNAIESAVTQLVSGSTEPFTETVTIEASEDLTAAEVEALVSEDLSTDVPKSLAGPSLASTTPDIQREQAIIRGLSALGELRLPLDEVLGLLTSKILWEAFYRRLYAWYGSLDAAQNVTAEDVEAAILNAYPEHRENEFVAEASARFTVEVEQAVNFAVSLPDYGWRGPRLRLHQANAAREMAEVLSGQSAHPFLLNADDPGMGKSATFLAAVCASGMRSIVLVAPKTVADDTWCARHGEIRRCLPYACIVRGLDATLTASPSSQLTFFVLHYEELLNDEAVAALAERSFDCLCLDEIHFIKQRAGQGSTHRRTALEVLRASTCTAIGLTGTLLINELTEPISLLQTLSQHAPQFDHARLSNRRMGDIADVFEALLPHIIRRRKREVLLHLPGCDVRTVDIPLPPDIEEQMRGIYSWPRARATQALVELRKRSTDAKLPYLLQRAQTARKLLIQTYLTDDVSEKIFAYLEDFLPNQIAHINGQTPRAGRQKHLNSFRAPDGVRVLVGTIGTIGTGLTLFDPVGEDTANEIIIADLPYTWAEFEQGIARLYREGQRQRVLVDVLQTTTAATLRDSSALHTLDEHIWDLIEGKRELSDVAVDGKYDTTDAAAKVPKALRRWLKQARETGVEPLAVERRTTELTGAQKWRSEIGRLRALSAAQADEVFADPEYTREFLVHLKTSIAAKLSHQWLRGKLALLLRPDLTVVDMGCGFNPFADLLCRVLGLDRHDLPGQLRGKMENPQLPDRSADVLIYSLSLYGTASDLLAYFTHAARILRGGGHLFIVEPASAFSPEGLVRFLNGLRQFGFELVGSLKGLRSEDGTLLKGMHLTLTGEMGKAEEAAFERK